jgi:endo-1,4-beta-xylanase
LRPLRFKILIFLELKKMRPNFLIAAIVLSLTQFATAQEPSLKDAYKNDFKIGVALNYRQIMDQDPIGDAIVKAQFNSISPENAMKFEPIHPKPGTYNFKAADAYVDFGEKNNMFIIGHNLVWHAQVPKWIFEHEDGTFVSRKELLKRMRDHIKTVVGRYKGRIKGWDVVNEALNEDGTLRQSLWYKIIGPDYIVEAFKAAHKADPQAELYYNDYSLENEPKRNGAVALIKKLQAAGCHVTGIGSQEHDNLEWPTTEQVDTMISAFAALGVKVMVTELDIDVLPQVGRAGSAEVGQTAASHPELNPYVDGLPDAVQKQLADRYAALFATFLKHKDAITRVTFWNVTDGDSWKNNWPVPGRKNYPLLFDREGKPKPAFDAVIKVAQQ